MKKVAAFFLLAIFISSLSFAYVKKPKGKSACTAGKVGVCKTWGNKGFQCDPSESTDCGGTTIVLPSK